MIGFIYALRDPRTDIVRYVGRTVQDPRRRLSAHLRDCHRYRHHCANWLSSLKALGLRPRLEILEKTEEIVEREVYWIERLGGPDLTNSAPGGLGGSKPGRTLTPQHKERLSRALLGQKYPHERCVAVSRSHGGRPFQDSLGRVFQTLTEAERITGVGRCNIWCNLKGRTKTAGGLEFVYVKTI